MNDEENLTTHESEHDEAQIEQDEAAILDAITPYVKSDYDAEDDLYDNSIFGAQTLANTPTPRRPNVYEDNEFPNIFGQGNNQNFLNMLSSEKPQIKDQFGTGDASLRNMID